MNRVKFFTSIPAMPQDQRRLIQWAYFLAKKAHDGHTRDTGERYFEHLRAVALLLIEHGYTEAEYVVLAVLHDSLEDTTVPLSMLEQLFGPRTAREILSLSKVYGLEDPLTGFVELSKKRANQDYFDGIRAAGRRPMIVKCADRIHNLTDLVAPPPGSRWTPEKRLAQVAETREWILPLAEACEPRFAAQLRHLCEMIETTVATTTAAASSG